VRLQAARLFEQDVAARRIATILRVSTKWVYQRRRAWRVSGDAALAPKGRDGSGCKLELPAYAPDLNPVEGPGR
jgi:hypothetical protein